MPCSQTRGLFVLAVVEPTVLPVDLTPNPPSSPPPPNVAKPESEDKPLEDSQYELR